MSDQVMADEVAHLQSEVKRLSQVVALQSAELESCEADASTSSHGAGAIRPSHGLDAVAYSFRGIRPAR